MLLNENKIYWIVQSLKEKSMNCCQCQGIEKEFNRKYVSKELKKYHKNGASKTTLMLISALQREGVKEKTLLDIGGGLGAIQYELFKYGLKSVTSAEASTAYLKAAKQEAQSQGYYEKIQYHHGDFIELATQINPADIVTLDRVICCYHNMKDLVKLSSSKSKKLYAVVYPRDIWWVKLILLVSNLFLWLVCNPFRIFAHPSKEIDSLIVSDGFTRNFYTKSGIWQIVIYKRQMQRENLQ